MKWIVKIEGETNQRIKIEFQPIIEKLRFSGEYKPKNKEWEMFSMVYTPLNINLEDIQKAMSEVVETLKQRVKEYENIAKGFSVIKLVAFEENED